MKHGDKTGNEPQIVFALYRPHQGKDAALLELIGRHIPILRRLELVTERPVILVKSKNGTFVEIFEWRTGESAGLAHEHPEVAKVWEAMAEIADLPRLESLDEAKDEFPHFDPVEL